MRTVCGSVALEPLTLIVIESTANGTGNFFHDEWQRNISGHGDKHPVFIPWYQIEIYTAPVRDEQHAREIWQTLTPYEKNLWHKFSLSIEQIKWYHDKAREYPTADQMHAEFPTTPDEAFVNTGANVFAAEHIEALRAACSRPADTPPDRLLRAMPTGQLDIWQRPRSDTRYIAAVDVGGRTARADWSVIAVFTYDTVPELVAQWRGHIDHDLLADYAMTLAATYNRALLVVESNTLESENMESSAEGILTRMHTLYDNLYCRRAGATDDSPGTRPGLHTNRATKAAMIERLISAVRPPASYIERDSEACNELASYLCYPNGSYAARRGKHDDLLMTRAIALYVISLDPPRIPAPRHRLLPAILPRRLW